MNKITVRSSYPSPLGLKIHAVCRSILKFGNLVVDHEYGSGQNIKIAENFFIFFSFIKRKRCLCLPLCYHKSKPSFFSSTTTQSTRRRRSSSSKEEVTVEDPFPGVCRRIRSLHE
ncbi:hypothetical protein RDI58_020534 [Solanum bulbocastanum]|uniref:Uncharacterized protein n=1 Tax=Solanum bulbocastanum TaxID=147425 RepID=A0AAN8TDR3_SOLBU